MPITGARYHDIIIQFLVPKLDYIGVVNKTVPLVYHFTTYQALELLNETFPDCVPSLSFLGDQNWPPKSWDFVPLDLFLLFKITGLLQQAHYQAYFIGGSTTLPFVKP